MSSGLVRGGGGTGTRSPGRGCRPAGRSRRARLRATSASRTTSARGRAGGCRRSRSRASDARREERCDRVAVSSAGCPRSVSVRSSMPWPWLRASPPCTRASWPGTRASASRESTSPSVMCRDERLRARRRRTAWRARAERLHLHLAEAGERAEPFPQVGGVRRLRPDARGVAAVLVGDDVRRAPARASPSSPGKRWIAGFSRNTGSSSAGRWRRSLRVERAEALLEPSGPANAFCTVTCWSSAKPTSSASGSAAISSARLVVAGEVEVRRAGHGLDPSRVILQPLGRRWYLRLWTRSTSSARRRAPGSSATFDAPTPAQELGWPAIASGRHTLIQAPTGSGKTLAAFLYAIDRLTPTPGEGLRVLYVSPLKALDYDIERNLRGPLAGLAVAAARRGPHRRHAAEGARGDAARRARHPDHDARVAVPAAHLAGARDCCAPSTR